MELSIIITHYQTPELLSQCLKSIKIALQNSPYPPLGRGKRERVEIIVVDSQLDAKILKKLERKFSDVNFISFKKNVGYTKLVNAGLKKVRGDFILILNADIIVPENSLDLMLDFMKRNPSVGLLGPQQIFPDGQTQSTCFRFYTPLTIVCRRTILGKTKFGRKIISKFLLKDKNLNSTLLVDWLMGSALMVRAEALKKVGPLDERFFMYFQDVDWARRFWENSYQVVYFPKAKIYHYHQKASRGRGLLSILTNKFTRIHILDGIKYFWKYKRLFLNFQPR